MPEPDAPPAEPGGTPPPESGSPGPLTEPGSAPSAGRRVLFVVLRLVVAAAVAGAIAWATVRQWDGVRGTFVAIGWQSIVGALLVLLAGIAANMLAWRAALAELGSPLPVAPAARVALVGQLAKYVPGSLWAYVLQMELGRRAGVPRERAFLAGLLANGLGLAAGLLVGSVGIPSLLRAARDAPAGRIALYAALVLVPVALICAIPPVLTRLVGLAVRILRRPPLERPLHWSGVLKVIGFTGVAWICFGLHLWVLSGPLVTGGVTGLVRCVGAMTLAMAIGQFALVSAAGLGAREAVLVAALLPLVGNRPGTALGLALASRFTFIAGDVLAAGTAALVAAVLTWSAPRDRAVESHPTSRD